MMGSQLAKEMLIQSHRCIGRESNPGLAESSEMLYLMATANFTTKPPMLFDEGRGSCWACVTWQNIPIWKARPD
jgi:hypothetical protein